MQATDKARFGDALTALGIAFGTEVGSAMREVYWRLLSDLDVSAVIRGCETAGRTLKWFPKPAEIRDLSGESTEARAAEAWEAVRTAMDRHDYTVSVDFGPLVNAVVRNLGGWRWLCDQKLTALPFVRKDFERVFGAFVSKPPESLHGEALQGSMGGVTMRIPIGKGPAVKRPALPAREERSAADVRQLVGEILEKRS